jgi:hypothetical protein
MPSYADGVFGDSRTDTSSEGSNMAPQYDHDQELHHLATQLGVSEAMIRAATRCIVDMHTVMRDSSQRHVEMYGGIQRGVLPGSVRSTYCTLFAHTFCHCYTLHHLYLDLYYHFT